MLKKNIGFNNVFCLISFNIYPCLSGLYMMQTEYQKLIILHVIQDGLLEGNETFTIQLVSTGDAEISPVNGKELIQYLLVLDIPYGNSPKSVHIILVCSA